MKIKSYKDLTVWQKSIELVIKIYQLVESFPKEEVNGLSNQMQRAAVSIPSNIAEGYYRFSDKELLKFLYIARGSSTELETQLIISLKLNYSSEEMIKEALDLCEEIEKMLNAFISRINNEIKN